MADIFMRLTDVEKATGKRRSSIYDAMADGTFPRPVKIGGRAVAWLESEIIEWQQRLVAMRDGAERA
jgi:prophage regulatory protein